jgi:hypothetical protein
MTKKRFKIENPKAMSVAADDLRLLLFLDNLDEQLSGLEFETHYDVEQIADLLAEMNVDVNQMLRAVRRISARLRANTQGRQALPASYVESSATAS